MQVIEKRKYGFRLIEFVSLSFQNTLQFTTDFRLLLSMRGSPITPKQEN
jgi:hypothetical protein